MPERGEHRWWVGGRGDTQLSSAVQDSAALASSFVFLFRCSDFVCRKLAQFSTAAYLPKHESIISEIWYFGFFVRSSSPLLLLLSPPLPPLPLMLRCRCCRRACATDFVCSATATANPIILVFALIYPQFSLICIRFRDISDTCIAQSLRDTTCPPGRES